MEATAKATAATASPGSVSSHVVVYGLSNGLVAALNFVLLPVYARVLTPADYGAMSLIVTVCSAVAMFGMMGMNNAVQRFFFDDPDPARQQQVWNAGFVAGLTMTAGVAAVTVVVSSLLASRTPALAGWPVLLALASVVPQTVIVWLQDLARLRFRPMQFATLAVVQTVLGAGAGLVLVVAWRQGLSGFFAASLLAAGLTAVAGLARAQLAWPLRFARADLGRLIRFGAPFVPAGVFIWLSTAILRWTLAESQSLDEAGIFDVAWKLSAPVWMLNTAVGQAFSPYAFRVRAQDPDYREKLIEAFHVICVCTMLVVCAVALFAQELCALVVPAAFGPAAAPCAVLAFGFFFSATHQVTALGIAFAERSHLVAVGWGCAAATSVALALWLVPRHGALGAAACVALVYAGLNVFYLGWSQRLHRLPFRVAPSLVHVMVGAATVVFALALQRHALTAGSFGLKLLWLTLCAGVLIGLGGVKPSRLAGLVAGVFSAARRSS